MSHSSYHSIAETYDLIRPSYPAELIADIISAASLTPGAHLMEIGAGTGKATGALLAQGFHIDANELDSAMAEILRKNHASDKLTISVAPFEAWEPPMPCYDLIYCAQAFHWLDPKIKFEKCRQYLSPGGTLALIWYDPQPFPESNAHAAANRVIEQYFGPRDLAISVPMASRSDELENTPCFRLWDHRTYSLTLHNTPTQSLAALHSTPAFEEEYLQLSPEEQSRFTKAYISAIENHGGHMEAPMLFSLYLLKPI